MTQLGTSVIYTAEQKRAQKAYARVNKVKEDGLKDYRSRANKFPSMVINCGLLQTLAFFSAKSPALYKDIEEWFHELPHPLKLMPDKELVDHISRLPVSSYRAATTEALAFSTWIKRFAEGRYKEQKLKEKKRRNIAGDVGDTSPVNAISEKIGENR